jgi:hypothetical protein
LFVTLVVVAFVGLLVVILLPGRSRSTRAPIARCRAEQLLLLDAMEKYQRTYGQFPPLPTESINEDRTFGGPADPRLSDHGRSVAGNAELMAVLLDLGERPDATPTVNSNHVLNPRQIRFLTPKHVADTKLSGVGRDLVYRDPWGQPYVISLELNADGRTRDLFHAQQKVSQLSGSRGFNGLTNEAGGDQFQAIGRIIIWSSGPDGRADTNKPADVPPNADNIRSWMDARSRPAAKE